MEITSVCVDLVPSVSRETASGRISRLLGFASVLLDHAFVVKDIRLIDGRYHPFLAFPSRKVGEKCPRCFWKNPLMNRYCGGCGIPLPPPAREDDWFVDTCHPISNLLREQFDRAVFGEYERVQGIISVSGQSQVS